MNRLPVQEIGKVRMSKDARDYAKAIDVRKAHGGASHLSADDPRARLYSVSVNGELLRKKNGVGRAFKTYEAAEKAGAREWMRRRVQP